MSSAFLATIAAREWIRTKPRKSPAARAHVPLGQCVDDGPISGMLRSDLKQDRQTQVPAAPCSGLPAGAVRAGCKHTQ